MKQIALICTLLFTPVAYLLADDNVIYWTGLMNRWGGGEQNSFSSTPKGSDFTRPRSGDTVHMVYHTNFLQGRSMEVRMNREDVTVRSLTMAGPRDRGFTFDGSVNNFSGVVFLGPVNVLGGHHKMETTTGTPIGLRSNLLVQVAEGARLETQIPFTGNAGILKAGNGTFVFNDARNTYTGLTLVREGVFGGNGSLAGDLFVEKGAKLLFDPSSTLTVNGKASFGGFRVQDLAGLDRNTPIGTHTLIRGEVDPANIAPLGPDQAHTIDRNKVAYFEADASGLRLVVENRSRRGR